MIKYDNLYIMYNPVNMDYTFIGDNMELIEINRNIEEAKANYELAKNKEQAYYYRAIIEDLRDEKKQIIKELLR